MKKFLATLFFLLFSVRISYALEVVPGDVIVVLRAPSGFNAAQYAGGIKSLPSVMSFAESLNANVVNTYDSLTQAGGNIFMLIHSDMKDEHQLLREIQSRPDVIAASLNHIYTLNLPETPNDPEYFRLGGMDAINAPQAWSISTGSDDVYVAVVDSGIDFNHPDLSANFSHEYSRNFLGHARKGYDPSAYYDERGHGTHVAGTIAGVGNNALGVAGVNWRAKVFSVRCLNANGGGVAADIIASFNYIAELLARDSRLNIAAVNFSVGGYDTTPPEELIAGNDPIWLALKTISDTDRTVICAAAGNENNDIGRPTPSTTEDWLKGSYSQIGYFLGLDNMIVVAAASRGLTKAYFSNYSRKYVDIAAPGMGIISAIPLTLSNDTGYAVLPRTYPYATYSGTSMATPHVAGSIALLKSIFLNATASQLKAAILGGANGDYLRDDEYGTSAHGLLDLTGAINFMVASMSSDTPPQIGDSNLTAGVVNQRYKTEFYASGTQPITWTLDGTLPGGLMFEGGKISGTPKEAGTFPFTVTASNAYGSSSLALTLNVSAQIAPLIRRPDDEYTLSPSYVSMDYKTDIDTAAGDWPMKWSLGSGDFPVDFGAKVDGANGVLSFTPTRVGTFSFPVTVANDSGIDSYTFSITVNDAQLPKISRVTKHAVALGRPLSLKYDSNTKTIVKENISVVAYGTKPLSWDVRGLPEGVRFITEASDTMPLTEILTLEGRPEESGDFAVVVTVSNDFGVASADLSLTVEDIIPVFSAMNLHSLEKNTEFSLPVPVYGSAPITFTISGDIPEGTYMRYDDNTPIFYGKPTKTGHYRFTIIAENACGKDDNGGTFDLYVHEPSAIATHILPDAVAGVSYDAKISLRSDVAMSWAISADKSLNLKISDSGMITGLPSKEGRFTVNVTAKSPDIRADFNANYSLIVRAAPAITTTSLPDGKMNTPYPATILSADGTTPVMWSVSEGEIPGGLTLSRNGHVYGTPTEAGSFVFTLTASNKAGHDAKIFTLKIASDDTTPASDDKHANPSSDDKHITPSSDDKNATPSSDDKSASETVKITQGAARGLSSLTIGELASIESAGEKIGAIIPEISVSRSGFYTFESVDAFGDVKISPDVPAGWLLVWNAFTRNTAGALLVEDAADNNVQFYDSEGNVTIYVPENHIVNVSAWLDAGKTYAPVISAAASTDRSGVVGSSSGGCDSFASCLMIMIPLLAHAFRKR